MFVTRFVKKKKKKKPDGFSGARGTTYESRMCMLCVVRGYTRGLTDFELRYQVPESEAGKFDDVIFDEGGGIYQVFQLKHKEKEEKLKIFSTQLFNENFTADYNLLKYVKSLHDVKLNDTLKGTVGMAAVLTNIDFDIQKDNELSLISNGKDWYKGLTCIQLRPLTLYKTAIYDTSNLFADAKYYKFDNDPNIIHILKRQSETFAKELRAKLETTKNVKVRKKDENQSKKKQKESSGKNMKCENQQKVLKAANETLAKVLQDLTENDIREALQYIVYAVRQPNDTGFEKLIKEEIKDYFKLQNVDTVYNAFEVAFFKWCNTKEPIIHQMHDPNVIQFKDVEIFFQQNVKNISFGEITPTSTFTGRKHELNLIREKLDKKHDLIVSQSVAISGLGGIGKTELTKQFIKEFGQSDFYGRVIWIEAESDESVKKSFKALAEKVDIQDREKKLTSTLIDQIFDYFHGVKVLFVFDNFDNNHADAEESSDDKEKNLIIYCQKKACDPTKKHRPYFIFTSRNRKCLPDMLSLDLDVLTKEDANEFIKKELAAKNYTNQDVEELAQTLQYFPLGLQQAIAYINKQDSIEKVSGGRYEIQNYLKDFVEKTKELLNHPHINDFGEYGKTTWIALNVNCDAISRDETNGPNALRVIQFMSYLYADQIDAKMFLSLFKNDSKRNGEAFLLLEKYSIITRIGESTFYQIHRLVQVVVQLKFKDMKDDILEQAWTLIFPELYEYFLDKNQNLFRQYDLIDQCTIDQILHYNNLAIYMKKHKYHILYWNFLKILGSYSLGWVLTQDADTRSKRDKRFEMSQNGFKEFGKRDVVALILNKSEKVVNKFMENGYLGINYVDLELLLTIVELNYDFFKYLVEIKSVNLIDLKLLSQNLIREIIQGKLDLLSKYIETKETEDNQKVLKEALFFASLFNQETIVELLIANKVQPDYNFCEWVDYAPIIVAALLKHQNILEILLKTFDKLEFKDKVTKILFDLLNEKYFSDNNCFEIVFKKYIELGGEINDQHSHYKDKTKYTFLCYATDDERSDVKTEIVDFLVDNGANPCLLDGFKTYLAKKIKIVQPEREREGPMIWSKTRAPMVRSKETIWVQSDGSELWSVKNVPESPRKLSCSRHQNCFSLS